MADDETAPQVDYRVVLTGRAFTEVDMIASSPEEAARKAVAWAQSCDSLSEMNHVDVEEWDDYDVSVSEDQSATQTACEGAEP